VRSKLILRTFLLLSAGISSLLAQTPVRAYDIQNLEERQKEETLFEMPNDTLEKDRSSILQKSSSSLTNSSMSTETLTFTNAGATGRYGPTQNQINTAYSGTTLESKVTINTQGIQEWTVPATTTYTIDAYGANGGGGSGYLGGLGARIKGDFDLTAGDVIKIVVGQTGLAVTSSSSSGAGGGGGTYVMKSTYNNDASVLVIAGGGGGGANYESNKNQSSIYQGQSGTSGGSTKNSGGGTNGSGGGIVTDDCCLGAYDGASSNQGAAGGGGLLTDGTDTNNNSGGHAFVNGSVGGTGNRSTSGYTDNTNRGHGGFGGGGGARWDNVPRSGGGGGYSGGQGGYAYGHTAGGGGGSKNTGSNQTNTANARSGHGQVIITYIPGPSMTITAANSSGTAVADGATTNDATLTLTFTSSDATSNFVAGDITVSGGAISNFAATSSTVYTATFTPSANGATTIDVAAGTFTDANGDNNQAATQFNWTYDTVSPTMTITAANGGGSAVADGATSSDANLTVTFTSNEATSNFAAGDITVSGGSISNFSASSTTVYTATFTPSGNGATTIDVAANKFTDTPGNNNTAATQFNRTFDNSVISSSADGARSVYAVDIDNDGDMDVLSASYDDDKIAWYENDGASNPSFTARTISTSADGAHSVYATDIDNDGDMDVLSASFLDDKIAWYENDGAADPSFTPRNISTSADGAHSVYATDIDSDGDMDVLSASYSDDKIAWYENDGAADPSFTPRTISTSANGAYSVYATDIDSDGDMDVLSASYYDDKIAWYESDGAADPSFTPRTISTSADGASSVYAADYDNDGDMDILSASSLDDKIAWYESDGASDPSFTARTITTSADGAISVFAADVDNDGDMDVLSASILDDKIAWYENGLSAFGDPAFGSATITTSADGPNTVYAADIDSDGDLDVLSSSGSDDKIAWYESDGASDPSFTARTISTSADYPTYVYAADIDNDGDMDVLSSSYLDDKIAWYENDGAADPSFTARTIATDADAAYSVFAADIDNDGDMDVLSAAFLGRKIAWYENDGAADPSFTANTIATSSFIGSTPSVYAADIDNDGDMDVLSASTSDDKIAWYENDGAADPSFTANTITTSADYAQKVYAADIDNDGDIDVLSASINDDKIAWYENDGAADPSFTARTISTSADGARSVYAADVDNDGDMDVFSASYNDDKIAWYENDGAADPSFTARTITTSADGANSVYAADIDNDGDMDVLSAAVIDDKITWYENGEADVTAPTIASVSLAADNASIAVTMSENVYNTNGGSGNLEAADFSLSISGGNATLSSSTPSSISISGKVYTLGISLSSNMVYGTETLTVTPVANSIYDLAGNAASTSQSNNTATLNGVAQQLGGDINGVDSNDQSGTSVSMNAAGDRVAIGSPNHSTYSGHVRVYEYSSGSWTQLGADIDGEAVRDYSGWHISLNAAGDRVAIGAHQNDSNGNDGSGHVRVYSYNGSAWSQLGADIDGEGWEDLSGWSLSMNSTGDRVAIGAYKEDDGAQDGGHVRVYSYNGSAWTQLGADIDGKAVNDYFGYSVSMNAAGDRVTIGALGAGLVSVYEYSSGSWSQLGADIDGEESDDYIGTSVSMNSIGDRVAMGAYYNDGNGTDAGHVRVYEYSSGSWSQLGADIDGEAASDLSGESISMNAAGNRIAIGARGNDGNGSSAGHVRVYEYSSGSWSQLQSDIDGVEANEQFGASVSMNAAGDRVAIGARLNDDAASNAGQVRVYELKPGAPTMTITATDGSNAVADGATTNDATLTLTFTASAATSNFAASDITVSGGAISNFAATSSTVYTATFTPSAAGATTIDVAANTFTNSGGVNNTAADQFNWTYDNVAPTMTITAANSSGTAVADGATTNDATLTVTFTSSEATSNFAAADITVSGGAISNFAATSSTVYTATFTPTAAGATTIDVAVNTFTDAAGNNNTAATQFNWSYDPQPGAPTMTITAANSSGTAVADGATTNDGTLTVTFTSSEATSNFASTDITVSGGTISSFNATSSTVYTATFTPSAAGATTIDVAAGTFTDAAGNDNTAADQFNWTYDNVAPTMTITAANSSGTAVADGATTNDATLTLTFTSSEATSTFAAADITVSGGTISSFTATSSTVYTATFTPTKAGETTIDVAAGTFTDALGNDNTAATQFNWTYDNVGPAMTITAANSSGTAVADGATTNDATLTLTFTTSEATSNFAMGDISVTGGTISDFTATSSTVYTATFTPTAAGATTIDVAANTFTDALGNNNTAADQFNWTYDNVAPTMTITAANSSGTAVADSAITNDATLTVTFTSSEATSNFAAADITVSGGAISNFAATSSTVYTATFTPSTAGTTTIDVAAGAFTDVVGNDNTAADQFNWTYDNVGPTMTITAANSSGTAVADAAITSDSSLTVTFTSSEATNDFAVSDISVTGGTISDFTATSSTVYTATFTPTKAGETTIDVDANTFTDAYGNSNTAADQFNWRYETSIPFMNITATNSSGLSIQDSASTNDPTLVATFTSSEPTSDFTESDISVTGATLSSFTATNAKIYTATVTPITLGEVTLSVAANSYTNEFGVGNLTSNTFNWIYDVEEPTLSVVATNADGDPIVAGATTSDDTLTIIFTTSEAVNDFTSDDLSVTGGSIVSFTATSETVYTIVYASGTGNNALSIPANAFTDAAGNGNAQIDLLSWTYDNIAPEIVITAATSDGAALETGRTTNDSSLVVTFAVSELVTGLDSSDISATGGALTNFITVSDTVYSALFTPKEDGPTSISVTAGAFTDVPGNPNTASNVFAWTYDGTPPGFTLALTDSLGGAVPDSALNNAAPYKLNLMFTEPVLGFTQNSIKTTGGRIEQFVTASASIYSATFVPELDGLKTVRILSGVVTDSAGNPNTIADSARWIYDGTPPEMAITVTTESGEPVASGSSGNDLSLNVTFTATEKVEGFTLDDINVSGGTLSALTGTLEKTFTAIFTSVGDGDKMISIDKEMYSDKTGNLNQQRVAFDWYFDLTPPMMGEVSEGFGEDRDWVGLTLPVRWTGFTDRSGIAGYELSLGTVPGSDNFKSWFSVGTDSSYVFNQLELEENTQYYTNVRATDMHGNLSRTAVSDGFRVDFVPPEIVSVSVDKDTTFRLTSDVKIEYALSEPIFSTSIFVKSERFVGPVPFEYEIKDQSIELSMDAPFISGDNFTITVSDMRDKANNSSLRYSYNYPVSYLADFNIDGRIDVKDFNTFTTGWQGQDLTVELGPTTGVAPHLRPQLDGTLDLKDGMAFYYMWHWQQDQAGKMIAKQTASQGRAAKLSHTSDRFTVTAPKNTHAAEIIINYPPSDIALTLPRMQSISGIGTRLAKVDTVSGKMVIHQILSDPEIYFDLTAFGRNESFIDISYTFVSKDNATIGTGSRAYELKPVPAEFALKDNYPNPFNPRTTIQYDLPISGNVSVIIYNVAGQEVKRLVNSAQEAGYHSVVWNGTNLSGGKAAAGIYFYQIQAGGFVRTKKMLLLK
jgi:hypothetical protein